MKIGMNTQIGQAYHRTDKPNLQVLADRKSASIQSNNDSTLFHPW